MNKENKEKRLFQLLIPYYTKKFVIKFKKYLPIDLTIYINKKKDKIYIFVYNSFKKNDSNLPIK